MASYQKYKDKSFEYKKDATAWTKKIKKDMEGGNEVRIEVNYMAGEEMPWKGIVFLKT